MSNEYKCTLYKYLLHVYVDRCLRYFCFIIFYSNFSVFTNLIPPMLLKFQYIVSKSCYIIPHSFVNFILVSFKFKKKSTCRLLHIFSRTWSYSSVEAFTLFPYPCWGEIILEQSILFKTDFHEKL